MFRKKGVKVLCVKCMKKHFVPTKITVGKKEKFPFTCVRCGQNNVVNIEVVRRRINTDSPLERDEVPPSDKLGI